MSVVVVTHNAGFFSCCNVKLCEIKNYLNENRKLPDSVDSSAQFKLYKKNPEEDITFDFFEKCDDRIQIHYHGYIYFTRYYQLHPYSDVPYDRLIPFIKKYFTPSVKITELCNQFVSKYQIDTENCIGIYYRGTDKYIETKLDSFDSFYDAIHKIKNHENLQLLIQTDSATFLDYMKKKFINRHIIVMDEISTSYSNQGIHYENSPEKNYEEIKCLFASFLIISKCKYMVFGSSNSSLWMTFYRGNIKNTLQNLNGAWYNNIVD